jgi:hypothetical protein
MRSLNIPSIVATTVYSEISSKRKVVDVRDRLRRAKGAIYAAYDSYAQAHDNLAVLSPANTHPAVPKDLKGNYEYLRTYAPDVSSALRANNPGDRCPLCAQAPVATFDHYLPQARFPEFAVLPINLVPCCLQCNKRKLAKYQEGGAALFLHAYLDELPVDERFLFADVRAQPGGIALVFWVDPPETLRPELSTRIRTHFAYLKLGEYYVREGVTEFADKRRLLENQLDDGWTPAEMRTYLLEDAMSVASSRGINHWRYVVLDALAESVEVCSGAFRE